ncbi:hypothetical protein FZEAL_1859 [Fusarium zealandicum]|uniref:C2H2-type domain-containing protein n=1 Tax=Fusarium zealandicum TaxID=1053134 RepID=A0A8H4US12_9HYPO|nr:hypothetical protein FZEAL_1859 [Fusarium zealandicum]
MYLTSPSTSDSPASQHTQFFELSSSSSDTSCPSEGPVPGYHSPLQRVVSTTDFQSSSDITSPCYNPRWYSGSLPELQSPPPMDHGSTWVTPDGFVAASTSGPSSSVESDALSAEFNTFAAYETFSHTPYQPHESYMPANRNPSVHHSSLPPSTSHSGRTPAVASRHSFGYLQDPSNNRLRIEGSVGYYQGFEPQPYPASGPASATYNHASSPFASNLQPELSAGAVSTWPKQEYDVSQYYQNTPAQIQDSGQDKRLAKGNKVKRPTRKHTSKEEANFQCEVKGCGKFFSRSYNYKSHLETHDEKREYPFPCTVDGCTKKFVRKTDLQRHHQSVHMKERNHKCDYCGRLFARKDTLRRHMEDGCSKRFDIGTLNLQGAGFTGLGLANQPEPPESDARRAV